MPKPDLFLMSNLRTKDTGVERAVIWVSAGEFGGADSFSGPRLKVVVGTKIASAGLNNAVTCTLADPPLVLGTLPGKIQKQVLDFVGRNRQVLLRYWKNEIDTGEMADALVRAGMEPP